MPPSTQHTSWHTRPSSATHPPTHTFFEAVSSPQMQQAKQVHSSNVLWHGDDSYFFFTSRCSRPESCSLQGDNLPKKVDRRSISHKNAGTDCAISVIQLIFIIYRIDAERLKKDCGFKPSYPACPQSIAHLIYT